MSRCLWRKKGRKYNYDIWSAQHISSLTVKLLIVIVFCNLLVAGCGLEEYYVVEAPDRVLKQPDKDTAYDSRYFSFTTNETRNAGISSSFYFMGTAVYYKIFNNFSSADSIFNDVSNANTSDTYSAAINRLTNTYSFQPLGIDADTVPEVLIPSIGSDRDVFIRLTNYGDEADFRARIEIAGSETDVPKRSIPMSGGKRYSFDFGRTGTYDVVPVSGASGTDVDYNHSSSGFPAGYADKYFVDMYAVGVGRDTTYTKYYSKVLYLGRVSIDASDKNN